MPPEKSIVPSKIGSLLSEYLNQIQQGAEEKALAVEAGISASEGGIPVSVGINKVAPEPHESWDSYKRRVRKELKPLCGMINDVFGKKADLIICGNALVAHLSPEQAALLSEDSNVSYIELDPVLQVTMLDGAVPDVGHPLFLNNHPSLTGSGVKVAVLDSGIDLKHPHLSVTDSVETCGESDRVPGSHGTHCAGIIASQDLLFRGIAPDVDLINVKVLRANGSGTPTGITRGVDEAIDLGAEVLSMSLGFNHLPRWSQNGHGWSCPDGRCVLCMAVDNASLLDDRLVVVAAGNEHDRAEDLRNYGQGNSFDTELGCPGNARAAFTVGAITKGDQPLAASFSSYGPTSYGDPKPDLVAPGVNIQSTIPAPRDALNRLRHDPARNLLFGPKSGTSMATPLVAGAASLLIQRYKDQGKSWIPSDIKDEILSGLKSAPSSANFKGGGALDLSNL